MCETALWHARRLLNKVCRLGHVQHHYSLRAGAHGRTPVRAAGETKRRKRRKEGMPGAEKKNELCKQSVYCMIGKCGCNEIIPLIYIICIDICDLYIFDRRINQGISRRILQEKTGYGL